MHFFPIKFIVQVEARRIWTVQFCIGSPTANQATPRPHDYQTPSHSFHNKYRPKKASIFPTINHHALITLRIPEENKFLLS